MQQRMAVMVPEVLVCDTAQQLGFNAARWLVQQIQKHQKDQARPFSLALAGGGTPKRLYELLASQSMASRLDWQRILLLWGDERNVPESHPDSNVRMARLSLIDHVPIPVKNVLGVPDSGGDPEQIADSYEQLLRDRLPITAQGWPKIDCVLLGLGDDVHTASLFPHTDALKEKTRWVVANQVQKLACWRITLTIPAINAASRVAFLVSGASKSQALGVLWNGPRNAEQYPAQSVAPAVGNLKFFVDRDALGTVQPPESWSLCQIDETKL